MMKINMYFSYFKNFNYKLNLNKKYFSELKTIDLIKILRAETSINFF